MLGILCMILMAVGSVMLFLPVGFIMGGTPISRLMLMALVIFGWLFMLAPTLILLFRAKQTTAMRLLDLPKKEGPLWLYIMEGGVGGFMQSVRLSQAHLWVEGRGMVKDVGAEARLSIGGHDTRIVLEKVGHTVVPRMAQFAKELAEKFGLDNMVEARHLARLVKEGQVSEKVVVEKVTERTEYSDPEEIDIRDLRMLGIPNPVIAEEFDLTEEEMEEAGLMDVIQERQVEESQ